MTVGYINSTQSLGALDGPGIRYTVFLQGCNLRCGCCHNPETWDCGKGEPQTPAELVAKAERYREYFGSRGGITFTGGEPLLQAKFCIEVFRLCHEIGINTCLDTSGSIINSDVLELLSHTDRVLLDIKYTNDEQYKNYVGCSMEKPLKFLGLLQEKGIPTTVRQVIIPTLNDNEESILTLSSIVKKHSCVDNVELLPFKKICQTKYDNLGLKFPFAAFPSPDAEAMDRLNKILNK